MFVLELRDKPNIVMVITTTFGLLLRGCSVESLLFQIDNVTNDRRGWLPEQLWKFVRMR